MAEEGDFKVPKDDRNKMRRAKNRFLKKKAEYVLSSPEPPQSVIDVADSSDDSYYRRSKACNWSRYEEEIDFTENEQMNAADFEFLQEHPTRGSHFTFNSEKEWENDSTATKIMNIPYFNLNLSILNAGLQTIPFYKRMDYGELNFSRNVIKKMDEAAEKAEIVYKRLLKDAEGEISKKMQNIESRKSSAKSIKENKPKPVTSEDAPAVAAKGENDDELDKLFNMTQTEISKLNISDGGVELYPNSEIAVMYGREKTDGIKITDKGNGTEVESGNKGIQQWLDNILDN